MKQPIFETKAAMLEYLCAGITPDSTNPNRFYIIAPEATDSKKKKYLAWNNTLTLFGHELIKMFLDEYDHIPTPDELKNAALPRLLVVTGDEGMHWEIGVRYIKPKLLPFVPLADYEAIISRVAEEDSEVIVRAIIDTEERI